jgi:O-antigen/teichoic acid export membrane protein
MDKQTRSYKAVRNSVWSFLGYILPIFFSIVVTPIFVLKLGVMEYGIFVLLNTIMGMLLLADLGVGTSVVKYAAEYHGKGDYQSLRRLVGSAVSLFFSFGLIGLLVYLAIGEWFLPFFHLDANQKGYLFLVFALGGILFFVNSISILFFYLPKALQRYDVGVRIGLWQMVGFNLASVVFLLLGFKLPTVLAINILATTIALWVCFKQMRRLMPYLKFGFFWDWQEIKKCYRFGVAAFITNIANTALGQFDRLFIPIYLSTAELSYYSLPGNIALKVNGITGSLTAVLFPMVSALGNAADSAQTGEMYKRVMRNMFVLIGAMCVPIIFLAHKMLQYWLGQQFADKGSEVLVILTLTNALLAIYSILLNFLFGLGRVRFLMQMAVLMAVVNIVLLFLLVPRYGILGAAWAYLGAMLPILYAMFWVEKRILKIKASFKFYGPLLAKIAAVSFCVAAIIGLSDNYLIRNIYGLIIFGPLYVVLFIGLYYYFGFFEKQDSSLYLQHVLDVKDKLFKTLRIN